MKDIYILGSGGFAKEVYSIIADINKEGINPIYNFIGFVDVSKEEKLCIGRQQFPVFDENTFIQNKASTGVHLAVGIGNPKILEKLYHKFKGNFIFPNLIDATAKGNWESIELGSGNIITAGCIFTVDIKIGSFNIFNLNTTLGHDSVIGSFNVINPGVNISGVVQIGNRNLLGTNATILQNIKILDNSILGASSLLTKDLDSNVVAVGSPAKGIRENI